MKRDKNTKYNSSRYSNKTKRSASHTPKRKKRKLRIKKSIIRFISTLAVVLSALMIVGSTCINYLTKDISNLNKAMLEGRYLHSEIVKIDDVPQDMVNAVVAIEDSRFYSHKGIDIIGLARAFLKNSIKNTSEGASTLEMQISKNLVTSSEKSYERKLKDMKVAHEMNKSMSKNDIMQVYLNSIYLQRGATGIRAGARIFFAKDVSELNLAESALLAGITKNPSKYTAYNIEEISKKDTFADLEKTLLFTEVLEESETKNKTDEGILNHLIKLNLITDEQYELAKEGKIVIQKAVLNDESIKRQKVVLKRMRDLNFISKKQYEKALSTKIIIDTSLK